MAVSVSVIAAEHHKKEESLKLVGVSGFFVELPARFVCILYLAGVQVIKLR